MINEADGRGCLVESEFLQGGKANPPTGGRGGLLRRVVEGDFDEFERRASFEEGCQILNRNFCSRRKNEPRKGGEVKVAKVCADGVQRETREFWHSSSENLREFHVHFGDIEIVSDLEVPQHWCW